ncbi:TonB-dependent receptor domain-containing protein [Flavobacterium sp.]|uniref:TonB-dependent receptor n=1 Tax=Flavobacterium sp. TaxID=239 RepID=UPI0035278BDD
MQRIVLSVFLLLCVYAKAQYSFSGIIYNEKNMPLENVHIHVGNKITATNNNGKFSVENLKKDNYKIYISYIGYETVTETINVDKNIIYNKQLFPTTTNLSGILITEKLTKQSAVDNEQKINSKTIENYSNVTLGDALKEISGVSTLKSGTTIVKPVVNGLHSFRVPIITDNIRLEDQQWGVEHAPNFDVNAANSLTVLKGASTLQYGGDAIGGIVIIEPISLKKDTIIGKTIITGATNGRGGSISSSLTKGTRKGWAWNIVGTAKYFGDREAPNYVLSNTGNREQNFSGNLKYVQDNYSISGSYSFYNSQMGILKASHIGNVTDLYNAITNQKPYVVEPFSYNINQPKQEVQHHLAKVFYEQKLNESSKIDFQYAFQFNNRKEFDVRRNSEDERPALDLNLDSHNFQTNYKYSKESWKFTNGISFGYQNNVANPNTGVRPLIPNFNKFDFGIYSITNYKIDNSLKIEGGIRYDFSRIEASKYYLKSRWDERSYDEDFSQFIVEDYGTQWLTKPTFDYHNFAGSIGFNKQFHHEINWLFSIGLATRNPNVSELFSDGLHHAIGQIELGDLRLQQEKALKINSTIRKEWKKVTLEANPFINRIVDFIYLQPTSIETTIRGAFPVWEYKQTDALLTGIDVSGSWIINEHFKYNGNFAYLIGRDLKKDDYLIDMPPFNTTQSIQYTNKKWNKLLLELKSETVLNQTNYPNFNFETTILVNGNLTPAIVDISTPPNTYSLLHFQAECRFSVFKNKTITTAFSIQNLLNTNYRDYLNRQRFYADEMGRNFQFQLKFNY